MRLPRIQSEKDIAHFPRRGGTALQDLSFLTICGRPYKHNNRTTIAHIIINCTVVSSVSGSSIIKQVVRRAIKVIRSPTLLNPMRGFNFIVYP